MHAPMKLSAVATALYLSSAIASPLNKRGTAFTVQQNVPKTIYKTGPQALLHAYAKFGAAAPGNVTAAAANDDGSITANPEQYDSEYLAAVVIGGQTLNLDFDTGSSDLWVFSSELPASEGAGHTEYNPSRSSTAKLLSGETWDISYGDGSGASGNVYTDTVSIGATTFSGQDVELAESVSSQFTQDTDNDGLVGLAFDSINTCTPKKCTTFVTNVLPLLASPLFTANLKKGAPGQYDFGYIDSSQYTGSISYTSVSTANGFWEFTGSGYAVGSGSFVSLSIDGIADTGTTLLLLPSSVVTAYYSKVSGAKNSNTYGGYVFPCSTTLPKLVLGIGSYRATVPGDYLNYAPVTSGSSTCYGGLQSNAGIGFSIYGDIFLKAQFVVFDRTSPPKLGFAAKPGVS